MTEHPGWREINGERRRAFRAGEIGVVLTDRLWDVAFGDHGLMLDAFQMNGSSHEAFADLSAELGVVHRVRNPSLWDAIATAIIRQVIRAPHARSMYQNFCRARGVTVFDRDGIEHWLIPTAPEVLDLPDDVFTNLGMAFKRKGLRSAAEAYLNFEASWLGMPPQELVTCLQSVSHIGPWTARAAVADFSNDWALYPYDDLAVRTWARRAIPHVDWEDDEVGFAAQWRHLSGDQIANTTLLTLAWGDRYGADTRDRAYCRT